MKKYTLKIGLLAVYFSFLANASIFAQTPGGVTGASLWLKANAGTSTTGTNLTGWTDQTGINTFSVTGIPVFQNSAVNFNPAVSFNNTDAVTSLPSNRIVGNTSITAVDGFAVYKYTSATNRGALAGDVNAGAAYGKVFFSAGSDQRVYVGSGNWTEYQSYSNTSLDNKYTLNSIDISESNSPFATGSIDGQAQTVTNGGGSDYTSITLTPMIGGTNNSGSSPANGWYHFRGEVAELILFSSTLSATNKLKVESYLALKYGISLGNNTATPIYLNSAGTSIYANATYKYDVFGIGKDDGSGLNQPSSNSINTGSGDGTGQSGKGNIVLSNASSLDNGDFLIVGNDNGLLTEQSAELPASLVNAKRIGREWWVKHTGNVGTVDLSFDIIGLFLTGTTAPEFKLLVDNSDHDFSSGATIIPATSITGTKVNFTGVTLANNNYFTIVTSGVSYSSVGSADWTTASVWSPNGVPDAGDKVTINTGHTITLPGKVGGTAGLAQLTIDPKAILKGSWDVVIAGGGSLTVNGLLKMNTTGKLDFKGSATVTNNGEIYAGSMDYTGATGDGTAVTFSGDGVVVAAAYYNSITVPATMKADHVWSDYNPLNILWDTPLNWFPEGVPGASHIISISSNAFTPLKVVDARTVAGLHLPDVAILEIEPTGNITITGEMKHKGILRIQSTTAGTGSLIAGTVTNWATAVANVQRYLPTAGNWYVISSPVSTASLNDFATLYAAVNPANTKYGLATYDPAADDWSYYAYPNFTTGNFLPGRGYTLNLKSVAQTPTFSGTINVGQQNFSVTNSGFGWNAVGNPYTSAIAAQTFLTDNSSSINDAYQALYLWDNAAGAYVVIVKNGFTFTPPGGQSVITPDNIAVGQGFFIKAKELGSVAFKPSQQVHATTTQFKSAEIVQPAVRLSVTSGDKTSRAVVGFKTGLTAGLDPGYDVGKFKSGNLSLFSRLIDGSSTVDFEIQGLENKDYTSLLVPLGIDFAGGEAKFTIEANSAFPTDAKVYIEDTQLGSRTLLSGTGNSYTVTLPAVKNSNRFNLVVTGYKSGQIATGVDVEKQSNLFVYTRDRAIYVNGIADATDVVAVYGVDGKLHHRKPAGSAGLLKIDANAYPAGIYMVSVEQKTGRVTRKVVISE